MSESTVDQAVEARRAGNALVLAMTGELDLFAALQCGPQIDRVLTSHPPRTVVDLRRVTFLDCSGLALLLRVRGQVARWGGEFEVHCPDRDVLRILQYVELLVPLTFVEELPEG
ncbi:STAS domain-containing protein [Streptomyces sp. NPDC048442]|uniref:STAS domain-containing protein n=1 Tax=Streptomyces sp. NPDC048442 TaxID=3154823 RepID=UPI00341A124C